MRITVLAGGIGGARFLRGLQGPAARRGDHRHRQHRRRHLGPRPARVPRPRHRDVHPRRRHQRGARLGSRGRDLHGQGRARGVRRRADVVRAGRQGHRHPPHPHAVAGRRLHAHRGHRGALRPLAARRAPAADVATTAPRRTSSSTTRPAAAAPDGTPLRTAIHFQEWWIRYRASLPAHGFVLVGIDAAQPGPDVIEAIMSADVVLLPAQQPGRLDRHDPAGARDRGRRARHRGARRRRLPHRRRRPGARHGRRLPAAPSASRPRPPPSRCTTGPGPQAASSTPGSSTPPTPRASRRWRPPASAATPSPR